MSNLGISAYLSDSVNSVSYGSVSDVSTKEKSQTVSAEENSNGQYPEIKDESTISDDAMALYNSDKSQDSDNSLNDKSEDITLLGQKDKDETETEELPAEKSKQDEKSDDEKINNQEKLTSEQEQEVQQLKKVDSEVRAHEQAHLSAAAGLNTSAPTYEYEEGPDGNRYAVGGEVNISFSEGSDPEDNLRKAEQLKAAALAPADPSSQDRAVAQSADKMIAEAEKEISEADEETTEQSEQTEPSQSTQQTQTATQSYGVISGQSNTNSAQKADNILQNQEEQDIQDESTVDNTSQIPLQAPENSTLLVNQLLTGLIYSA